MDEPENARLVQRAYERMASGDLDSLDNLFDAEIEWRLPAMGHVPFAGTWRGIQGVRQFFQKLSETQDVVEFRPDEFIAQGDKVVVLGHFVMRVKSTGRESASDWAHVWTVTGGRITHFREYVDTAAVSRAHGGSAP